MTSECGKTAPVLPAFPRPPVLVRSKRRRVQDYYWMQDGMTLRDWFAGQALIGSIPNGVVGDELGTVKRAYMWADLML